MNRSSWSIVVLAAILSYLFIRVEGEHLGGFLFIFIVLHLYNGASFVYSILPIIGLATILSAFATFRKKTALLGISFLFPSLIAYFTELLVKKTFVNEWEGIISVIPFLLFSIWLTVDALKSR